jgi:hypothetical protein
MSERCTQEELDELFLSIFPPEKRPPPSSKYQSRKPGRSPLYDKERDDLLVLIISKLDSMRLNDDGVATLKLSVADFNKVNELIDNIMLRKRSEPVPAPAPVDAYDKERANPSLLVTSKLRPLSIADLNEVNELIDHIMLQKRINKP